jgi:hypothetical protein
VLDQGLVQVSPAALPQGQRVRSFSLTSLMFVHSQSPCMDPFIVLLQRPVGAHVFHRRELPLLTPLPLRLRRALNRLDCLASIPGRAGPACDM